MASQLTKTAIPYLDFAWNVTSGCSPAGEGCRNCYAQALHTKRHQALLAGKKLPRCYAKPFSEIQWHADRLAAPMRRKKAAVIGVCFMSDLFHSNVSAVLIARVFAVMSMCRQHRFVVLTKRPERMENLLNDSAFAEVVWRLNGELLGELHLRGARHRSFLRAIWPLPNVMVGTSVWDQQSAERNVKYLLRAPAAARWVSFEPGLGAVDFENLRVGCPAEGDHLNALRGFETLGDAAYTVPALDWVVMGCEQLAGGKPGRPMSIDWVHSVHQQCGHAGVPFYFKQAEMFGRVIDREKAGYSWSMESPAFFNLGVKHG